MQAILSLIESRAAAVDQHPFLRWVRDDAVPARQRLGAWLPEAAFFVFGFRDLNAEVLRYPADTADPLAHAINRHLAEDATHWTWYLQDLVRLGLDREWTFIDALRFLWGRDCVAQRRAVYRLCALAGRAEAPALRYCLIAALEAVAHRLFAELVRVAAQFERETGATLAYLGPKHFEREPGHLTHQGDTADAVFAALPLDAATRASAIDIAFEVIALVEARWTEFHRIATARATRVLASH